MYHPYHFEMYQYITLRYRRYITNRYKRYIYPAIITDKLDLEWNIELTE